jgi:hypothetical protein
MKTLSLLQPWATLVVMGAKKIETRSWNTKYRGEILIHASANKKEAELLCGVPGKDPFKRFIRHCTDLPFGAIIGKANIVSTATTTELLSSNMFIKDIQLTDQEKAFGDYTPGRYGWLLKDAIQFRNPVKAKGSLSLWEHPDIHEEEIICPECNIKQWATVEHTIPFASYVHHCKKCKYIIMESEWNKA